MVQTIKCPECGTEIPLTEAISSRLSEEIRREYECKAQAKERELTRDREALAARGWKCGCRMQLLRNT